MSAKLTIDFDGFDALKKQLDRIGGEATKRAVEGALRQSQQIVAKAASEAMKPHSKPESKYSTGETKGSIIKDGAVEWTQDTATIDVGFDIEGGGLPSIFLMYGTTVHGQPHIAPDRALYNAVYGKEIRKQCREAQEEAFRKVIERTMKA